MANKKQAAEAQYHHGDLRRVLMQAALKVIRQTGIEGLSLRAIGRKVGVTAGAPYHHFKDRQALLVALAIDGFNLLQHALTEAASRAKTGDEGIADLAHAYMDFAQQQPAYYQVMFSPEVGAAEDQEVRTLGRQGLLLACRFVSDDDTMEQAKRVELAISMWSLLHGINVLGYNKVLPVSRSELKRIAAQANLAIKYGYRPSAP